MNAVFNLNVDNEANPGGNRANIIISPTSGLQTNENGAVANFRVVLESAPTADVTINFQTSDPSEGKLMTAGGTVVDSTSITFSPDPTAPNGFNTPQTVQIKGQDDAAADGNIVYRIITTVSSLDPNYAAIDPSDVGVTNNDNETPGLTLTPQFLVVFEGQTGTISAVLNRQPTADVTLPLRVSDTTEVQLNRTNIVFTSQNFNVPQTILVTGINDNLVDGNQPFGIFVDPALSSDPTYSGLETTIDPNGQPDSTIPDISGTVVDTNTAAVKIQPPGGLVTTEAGGTALFRVSLTSAPQPGQATTIVAILPMTKKV